MPAPPIPARRRVEIGKCIARLGTAPTFLDCCRVLNCGQITIQAVTSQAGRSQLGLSANRVFRPFSQFGLDDEFARWLRRWDDIDYDVPLTPAEQVFVVSRGRWIQFSRFAHDLPDRRWGHFRQILAALGLEASAAVMSCFFRRDITHGDMLEKASIRTGMSGAQLLTTLGPCRCCTCDSS